MKYILTKNKQLVSVLNYEPNTSGDTEIVVTKITDDEDSLILNKTHKFDTDSLKVIPNSAEDNAQIQSVKVKESNISFLLSTDWKILRHIREKHLGVSATLSEKQYTELETLRQEAAKGI
jgi:hypothetical protein